MPTTSELRVIILREGDTWVAQCLEYDIGAQAKTLDELYSRLDATINAERAESLKINGREFAGIDPAPQHYQDMWGKQAGGYIPTRPAQSKTPFKMAMCA